MTTSSLSFLPFCLQPTQNCSALGGVQGKTEKGVGGEVEKVREQRREAGNQGWHALNTKERHPWGTQSADFRVGGGEASKFVRPAFPSKRAVACMYEP